MGSTGEQELCPQEEERKPWPRCLCCLAPLLFEGMESFTDPALGMGEGGGGGVGRGLALFACPSGEPLTWLPAKNLLARHGPNLGEGAESVTSLARMLLSFLIGCPSFSQHIKHASPKPIPPPTLLPPQCHQSGSEPLQAANKLHPALLLPRLVPTAASPQDPSNPAAAGPWGHLEGS